MKIKYVGRDDDGLKSGDTVDAYGFTFEKGKSLDIPDDHPEAPSILARAKGNPWFTVVGKEPDLPPPPPQGQPVADPATYQAKA